MPEGAGRAGRWCRCRPDLAAAAALTVSTAAILAAAGLLRPPVARLDSVCLLAFAALVGWRSRLPVGVASAAGVLVAFTGLTSYASALSNSAVAVPVFLAVFLYGYALGAYCPWRHSLLGLIPLTAGLAIAAGGGFNPFIEISTVGPWLGGLLVASRRQVAEQLELRARELEDERDLFAVQSVRYERARIARELHDIVAHCVSLMVVQATAGGHLTYQDPAGAAEAFESIRDAARQAEVEIDRLLELLDISAPAAAPAGLGNVEELVQRVRASGLRVTCELSGGGDDGSEPAAEAAYRVVQEAVTNAMKHAPGASIDITVRRQAGTIEVRVVNQPAGGVRSGLEGAGGGHGLAGIRDRVARCGGTLSCGPTGDRGWRVLASLPRQPHADQAPVPPPAVG